MAQWWKTLAEVAAKALAERWKDERIAESNTKSKGEAAANAGDRTEPVPPSSVASAPNGESK